jgi:phage-related protein
VSWRIEFVGPQAIAETEAMPADIRARFLRIATLVETQGLIGLGLPDVRHLEGRLREFRMSGADGIARSIYVAAAGQRVVMLHSFVRKTQSTPPGAIRIAFDRARKAGLIRP